MRNGLQPRTLSSTGCWRPAEPSPWGTGKEGKAYSQFPVEERSKGLLTCSCSLAYILTPVGQLT